MVQGVYRNRKSCYEDLVMATLNYFVGYMLHGIIKQ